MSQQLSLFSTRDLLGYCSKYRYPNLGKTCVVRIPVAVKDQVKQFIDDLDNQSSEIIGNKSIDSDKQPTNLGLADISVDNLFLDPGRFQYKLIHNKVGSTGSLSGVTAWNDDFCGILSVWLDPANGKTYVVNGHNRYNLAVKLGVKALPCRYIKADNANQAKLKGAYQNIATGDGTILDAANIFRQSKVTQEDLKALGLKLSSNLVDKAMALANLEDQYFDQVLTGNLDQNIGIAAGQLNKSEQSQLIILVKKEKRQLSQSVLEELVQSIKITAKCDQSMTLDLFGETSNNNMTLERAKLISYIRTRLKSEELLFKKVSKTKNIRTLSQANNHIDQTNSSVLGDKLERVLTLFEQLKNTSGNIATMLTDTATKIANNTDNHDKLRNICYDYCLFQLSPESLDDLFSAI